MPILTDELINFINSGTNSTSTALTTFTQIPSIPVAFILSSSIIVRTSWWSSVHMTNFIRTIYDYQHKLGIRDYFCAMVEAVTIIWLSCLIFIEYFIMLPVNMNGWLFSSSMHNKMIPCEKRVQ